MYTIDFDLDDYLKRMAVQAGNGYYIVKEIEGVQESSSGLIVSVSHGGTGMARAVLLSKGPTLTNYTREDTIYEVGDVVFLPKGQGAGIYDPVLEEHLLVIGVDRLMARVPRKTWDQSHAGLAGEYRRDQVAERQADTNA